LSGVNGRQLVGEKGQLLSGKIATVAKRASI
jgi:hypothetical protein